MTKSKPRSPAGVAVSTSTEFTDYHGILELFGLRRTTAISLVNKGLIRSISLGEERRGKRLFHVESVREYLNSKLAASAKQQSEIVAKNGAGK
jgi:hypothetical protein